MNAPLALLAELTHRCPLRCAYCSNPVALARGSEELDTATWARVFREAAELGCLQVHLSGGEPTARRDILDLVAAAAGAGLYTNLITAGVLLDAARIAALRDAGLDHMQISVQGAVAETADRIAGYAGHERKLEVAGMIRAAGLPLTLNAVVHRQNLDELPALIALALQLGAGRLEVAHVQYYGWALANRAALLPTRAQLDAATATVDAARAAHKGRLVIDYVVPDYYAHRPKACMGGWGQKFLAVSPAGKVLPCHAAESISGMAFANVRDTSLRDAWENSEAFRTFRGTDWMPEPCRSCAHKETDWGGCRCQAAALLGDAGATDPACALSPHHAVLAEAVSEASSASDQFVYREHARTPRAPAGPAGQQPSTQHGRTQEMLRRTTFGLLAGMMLPAIAAAQQAPAPPAWQQGRPPEMANSTLAPHALPATVTPPERIPLAQLRVPEGFQVELWAHGMPGIRMMTRAEDGTIFAGTRVIGRVYWIRDRGQTRETGVFAQGLTQPNGVAMRGNALYVAAIDRILRFDNATANLASPTPVDLTAQFDIANDAHHGWRHIAFGPDGRLYIPRGVPCNICETDGEKYALILSFNPDGSDRRIEARGVRNSVGFDFHPATGRLWFTNHARDWAGNDNPSDTLHVGMRRGEHHGYPWCHGGFQDPAVPATRLCSEFPPPAMILGPHVAPIGTMFYTGQMFPEAYRNALFIALRGSWNRERLAGYELVVVREVEGRLVQEPFLTGLRDDANQRFLGRPAGLLTLPDGSLLMTDEQNGAIYRITYRR